MDVTWSFSIPFSRSFFRYESNGDNNLAQSPLVWGLVFSVIFAPMPHMGSIVRMDPKAPSKFQDVPWPSPPTPSSKSCLQI